MKISVVTVCYNAEKTLERTIQSVLAQDYPDVEYVIIDGASTDGTREILAKYAGKIRVISEKDQGIYDAMNKGWQAATGDLVHFLNADDWYANEHALKNFVTAIEQTSREANLQIDEHLWHGKLIYEHADGATSTMGHPLRSFDLKYDVRGIHQPATLFPRLSYQKGGGFNLKYRIASDYDLLRRYLTLYPPVFVDQDLVRMSDGGASATQQNKALKECIAIALDHGERPLPTYLRNGYTYMILGLRYRMPGLYHALKGIKDSL